MRLRTGILAACLCCLAAVAAPTCAAEAQASTKGKANAARRRTLGLVLEGGGALGLAHIGVIQWLEEHRIPVDYIAGTSMGGLIGGVYATGRNADEVLGVVKSIHWDEVMSGQTPFNNLTFRRKQDAREYPSTIEFGLRNGVQFPSGFNTGQQVALILDRIALPYSQLQSFDDLPIPFACVATDIVDATEHVFRSGPLDIALRSTMSLPGVFPPVHFGGHIYVDGGLLNNIPVNVAKEMGAEITLGIHLQTAPLSPDAALSSFGVLNQSIAAVVSANERRAMQDANLLVNVPLQKYGLMDFNSVDEIIKTGYAAAAANADKLLQLSVDEGTWKEYLQARDARRRKPPTPQFIAVSGVSPAVDRAIAENFSPFTGKPLNTTELDDQILDLTGTGAFSTVNYSIVGKDGQQGLQIRPQEKAYSPPIVRPLILIDGSSYDNVFFNIGARITFLNFGGYRRELRNDVIFGSQYGISSEYYRPITDTTNWFVAPRALYNNGQYPLFSGNNLVALYRNRVAMGGLDFGYAFGQTGELRFGYEGGYRRLRPEIGISSELPTATGPFGDFKVQYTLDRLDQPVVPRSGQSIRFTTQYFHENPHAPHGFPVAELQVQNFFRLNDPSSVFLNGYGGTSLGYATGIPSFQLGGVTRFLAYGTNELLTDRYFLFQSGYIRTLTTLPPLVGSTIDFIGIFEVGKTYQPQFRVPGDVAAGLIVNTIFGPLEVGGAVGNYGHAKFFFQIGRIF